MWIPLLVIACQVIRAATMYDLPLCRDHLSAMNWLESLRNRSWYGVGWKSSRLLQKSTGSVGIPISVGLDVVLSTCSISRRIDRAPKTDDIFGQYLFLQFIKL